MILAVLTTAGVQGKKDTSGQTFLTVITCNIGDLARGKRLAPETVVDYLKGTGVPDVLFLQEVWNKKEAGYYSQRLGLPYFVFLNDYKKAMGIAILSKTPLSNEDQIYFKASGRGAGAISADVMVGQKKVQLVNVHLDSVVPVTITRGKVAVDSSSMREFVKSEIWGESVRSRSAKELIHWLGEKKADHVILGGDFNTVPFSKTIRMMGSVLDDALWPSFSYFTGTYKKLDFPLSPRIDFLFFSPNLECRDASVLPGSPGDHLPVRASIGV